MFLDMETSVIYIPKKAYHSGGSKYSICMAAYRYACTISTYRVYQLSDRYEHNIKSIHLSMHFKNYVHKEYV